MATYAHTTPTPTSHVTSATPPASRRRTLFAAASAAVMGSGIVAGAAASVADLVEPSADAPLIAACKRVLAAIEKQSALTEPFEHLNPDDPYYQAHSNAAYEEVYKITLGEYHPSIAEAAQLSAYTPAGLQTKARLVLKTEDDRLALSLARDVLAGRV